jgi:ribosomal protein S18 acetylase RimI-like enzyme
MSMEKYQVRNMTRQEVGTAIEWAALEGWNPGLHDADCFYSTDAKGFFLGLLEGTPVGSISAVSYGASYGFLGFYIVKPEYRNRGFGMGLWNEAMKHLAGRNIGLDGVIAQQDNYKRSGFELAYRNIRYQWRRGNKNHGLQAVRLSDLPGKMLMQYDLELFGVERKRFLDCWISRPHTVALGIVQGNGLLGYGVLRKCRAGFKIGPLFADDYHVAETLFTSLTSGLNQDTSVFLDIPEVNAQAVRLVQKYEMAKVFETARMYTKGEPGLPLDRWFGVTTFELG